MASDKLDRSCYRSIEIFSNLLLIVTYPNIQCLIGFKDKNENDCVNASIDKNGLMNGKLLRRLVTFPSLLLAFCTLPWVNVRANEMDWRVTRVTLNVTNKIQKIQWNFKMRNTLTKKIEKSSNNNKCKKVSTISLAAVYVFRDLF